MIRLVNRARRSFGGAVQSVEVSAMGVHELALFAVAKNESSLATR